MPTVDLRPSGGFSSFTEDPGQMPSGTYVQTYRTYTLDGADLPTNAVIDGVVIKVEGQHQFTNPDSAHPHSRQRRWLNAETDDDASDWPINGSDGFSSPTASNCTGHSFASAQSWTRASLLAANVGFDLGWYNATPNPHWARPALVCDMFVTVTYHLEDEEPPPDPETIPPLPPIPCCASDCCDHPPSGPSPEGPTTPPDDFEHFPQCAAGGDLPLYEALQDSEAYY